MFNSKKVISLVSSVLLISCIFSGITSAAPIKKENPTPTQIEQALDPIFDPNYKEVGEQLGLDSDRAVAGYFVPFTNNAQQFGPEVTPLEIGGNEYYLKNISMSQITGNVIQTSTGTGAAPLSLTVSEAVATTFSTEITSEIGWSGAKIAGKLGLSYQATKTYSHTYGPINVPAGKTYRIYCAPTYNYYTYEIWEDDPLYDDYIGTYYYKEPTGLYFYYQDITGW